MALLTPGQIEFAGLVASGIGFDPAVIGAQCLAEMSGVHSQRREAQRNYNWLNIGWFDAGRGAITYQQTWGNNQTAAQATIDFFLGRRFGPSAGIKAIVPKGRGRDAQTQITAICTSGWATSSAYCSSIRSCHSMITRAGIRFPVGGGQTLGSSQTGNAGAEPAGGTETRVQPYEFSRGSADKKETSWECMGRLADEVQWRRFVRGGELWYVSEKWLAAQQPAYRISEVSAGVVDLSFDFETRSEATQATLRCQARRYSILPGDIVELVDEGPADGAWLVNAMRRSVFSQIVEVTLRRAQAKLPEPAPQVEKVSVGSSEVSLATAGGGSDGGTPTGELANVRLDGRWGGAQAVFEQFVTPFMSRQGLKAGSQKRSATGSIGSSSTSDHHVSQSNAYATDYPTYSGGGPAAALAAAMPGSGFAANTYNTGSISAGGARFRCQILWGSRVQHGDHVHVGLRRA
jgi:hypothetical protein